MTEGWKVELTGPARRALASDLPEGVAWSAYTFVTERLPITPYRLGGALRHPYDGLHSARLGTYRIVYRIEDRTKRSTCFRSDSEETCMASADQPDQSREAARDRVRQLVREQLRGPSLIDQLLAERRAAAAKADQAPRSRP